MPGIGFEVPYKQDMGSIAESHPLFYTVISDITFIGTNIKLEWADHKVMLLS